MPSPPPRMVSPQTVSQDKALPAQLLLVRYLIAVTSTYYNIYCRYQPKVVAFSLEISKPSRQYHIDTVPMPSLLSSIAPRSVPRHYTSLDTHSRSRFSKLPRSCFIFLTLDETSMYYQSLK